VNEIHWNLSVISLFACREPHFDGLIVNPLRNKVYKNKKRVMHRDQKLIIFEKQLAAHSRNKKIPTFMDHFFVKFTDH